MPARVLAGMVGLVIGLPPDASEHGARIDALLVSTARHASLVFAVALAWLAVWVLRSAWRRPGADDGAPATRPRASGVALVALAALTCGLLAAGWSGQPRRLFDPYAYEFTEPLRALGILTSVAGLLLGAAQLLLVANLVLSARRARAARGARERA